MLKALRIFSNNTLREKVSVILSTQIDIAQKWTVKIHWWKDIDLVLAKLSFLHHRASPLLNRNRSMVLENKVTSLQNLLRKNYTAIMELIFL